MSGKNNNKTERVDGRVDGKWIFYITSEDLLNIYPFGNISEFYIKQKAAYGIAAFRTSKSVILVPLSGSVVGM